MASRQALEESSGEIMRGCLQAIANGHPGPSAEVLGLARDVLTIQPPLQGAREVCLTAGYKGHYERFSCPWIALLSYIVS